MDRVYVILMHDRHVDIGVEVFQNKADAIGRAWEIAVEMCRHPGEGLPEEKAINKEMAKHGWIYYVVFGVGSDSVVVQEKELK